MKQADLAKALGLTQPTVSALKARGMPTDSVAAARAWRAAHVNPVIRLPRPTRPPKLPPLPSVAAGEAMLATGADIFSPILPAIRAELRAVHPPLRGSVLLSLELWDKLTEHLPLPADPTPLDDDAANEMGDFFYSLACGEFA
ncbi:MAG: hypothetical protein WAW42_04355 [Candidatus Competibacteraceae bacterium]